MYIRPWLQSLKTGWIPGTRRAPRRATRRTLPPQVEYLEEKIVLAAFDLVTVIPNQGVFLTDGTTMSEAPREVTLRFSPGQDIDSTTLGAISVWRAGLDGVFDNPATPAVESTDDVAVGVGYIGIGDNSNEVIVRFASTLQDDQYQIRIQGAGSGALASTSNPTDQFNSGTNKIFNFGLDLGAQVESVVPQPVIRSQIFSTTKLASLTDGDTITIAAGPYTYRFEINLLPNAVTAPGNIPVNITAGWDETQIANAIVSAINTNAGSQLTATTNGTITNSIAVAGTAFEPVVTFNTTKIDAFAKTYLTIADPSNLSDGDLVRMTLSNSVYTFEFNKLPNNITQGGNTRVDFSNGASAATIAANLAAAINGLSINIGTPQVRATVVGNSVAVTAVAALGTPGVAVTTGQPNVITQVLGTLAQQSDTVVVYFNQDQLDGTIAQNPGYYRLINSATGQVTLPQTVTYQYGVLTGISAAVLKFSAAIPQATYNLKVGVSAEPNDTTTTAVKVGSVFAGHPFTINEYLGDTTGTSSDTADADVYEFTTVVGGSFTFNLVPSGGLNGKIEFLGTGTTPLFTADSQPANVAESLSVGPLGVGTFRVRISSSGAASTGSYKLTITSDETTTTSDDNSSFSTATNLGDLGTSGIYLAGPTVKIENQSAFVSLPPLPGGSDEPGHRDVPAGAFPGISSGEVGHKTSQTEAPYLPGDIPTQTYSFPLTYDASAAGLGTLPNQITPEQKQIIRQIFAIYAYEVGIQFQEVASGGAQQIVVGDIRANAPSLDAGAAGGISGSPLIINAIQYANDNTYGGGFTSTAFHEIGHNLGLGHSYDVPSVQGNGIDGEGIFTGDNDLIHLLRILPDNASDIDLYQFNVTQPGTLSAQTFAERLPVGNLLDTELTLYKQDASGARTIVARNDDFYSKDSGLEIAVTPGIYFIGVTSSGNDNFDPSISNSGFGGRSDGLYNLQLDFKPTTPLASGLRDATGQLLDGDHDGKVGGEYNTWFTVAPTAFVDKVATTAGDGSIGSPYKTISDALAAAAPGTIVRVVGNGGADGDASTLGDNVPYAIGKDFGPLGTPLSDGSSFQVPLGVTVMIDAGALIKVRGQTVDVGSSSSGNDRSGGALQVLGTPVNNVYFTSWRDDAKGSVDDGTNGAATGGDWGGIVFRADSDVDPTNPATLGVFLNQVNHATLQFGGGQVSVDGGPLTVYNAIDLETSRPTITNNIIRNNADAAISANPDSFKADDGRIGPDIHGNTVTQNSTNGLFIRIQTALGGAAETLNVIARFDDTDITHVIAQNLILNGRPAAALSNPVSARLMIDPGTIVKLSGARIETGLGSSNLIAEGTAQNPIRLTSQQDDKFGIGGTFDLKNDGNTAPVPGNWSGIFVQPTSTASLDNVSISYAGGSSEISGNTDNFNPIEVWQAKLRVTNSVFENNLGGAASTTRGGRGGNDSSVIYVRGAQPVIVDNVFRNNVGNVVSINANSMQSVVMPDYGRSTGAINRYASFDDNYGPLVRLNAYENNTTNGMNIRPEELTIESIWDDTDIAHVLRGTISSNEFHTYGGLRLQSSSSGSLVVKLEGATAGFLATGDPLEISDRVGGTVQVVGQPGFPVVLTSLKDDTVSAGYLPSGFPLFDTNNDDSLGVNESQPAPGDWNSLSFDQYSNDRNVAIVNETEPALTQGSSTNGTVSNPQSLGNLAPNETSGDENRRLGFEVHGYISPDSPGDVDVYSFTANAGTEVWIDIDQTSYALDAMVELVNSAGVVLARSLDSQSGVAGLSGTLLNTVNGQPGGPNNSDLNTLTKDTNLGGDFYTSNFHDAGFRAILPGTAGTPITYFVRVRSQPLATHEADPIPVGGNGLTSGKYELQIRLRQQDEQPGSTVRYADIRFATNGIELHGLPAHSPLMGESAESTADNNQTSGAQYLGPFLQTDRNTLSVAGSLSSSTDVDFYRFTVDYSQVQVIGGGSDGGKFFPTMFDIDWADGLTRPDTSIAVFNSLGNLIYVGRASDLADDQPAPGQGQDVDDLSRGSAGTRDPAIGVVNLPAGVNGLSEAGGVNPNPPSAAITTYYVAVYSNGMSPTALTAVFNTAASPENQRVRLEPVDSVKRIVEDHIGFTGYKSQGTVIGPVNGPLIDIGTTTALSTNIRPFTLSDVNLFVTTSGGLSVVDPYYGTTEVSYGAYGGGNVYTDLDMRSDGRLYATRWVGSANNGQLILLSTDQGSPETGATAATDGIVDVNGGLTTPLYQQNNSSPDALAWHYAGPGNFDYLYYATLNNDAYATVVGGGNSPNVGMDLDPGSFSVSKLYRANNAGNAGFAQNSTGAVGNIRDAAGTITTATTGMQFASNGTLYGVNTAGQFYPINQGNSINTSTGNPDTDLANVPDITSPNLVTNGTISLLTALTGGFGFAGLTDAPQNVENARFANLLFAVTTNGRLIAIDPSSPTTPQYIFDTNNDGVANSSDLPYRQLSVGSATGLGFSPVDYNLWHPTTARGNEAGHGINSTTGTSTVPNVDNSRTPSAETQTITTPNVSISSGQDYAGASMYFGIEPYAGGYNGTYIPYASLGQFGVVNSLSQQNLTANAAIGNNYNVPGGTAGSLVTNSFSLEGYQSTDKPTIYFNYWLQTDNGSGKSGNTMTDSARVYISPDNGLTWQLLATNNATLSASTPASTPPDAELPAYLSTSRDASQKSNQQVQELFDSGSWRQARVDLNDYAGVASLKLRFDFSTSGRSGTVLDPTTGLRFASDDTGNPSYLDDTGGSNGMSNGVVGNPRVTNNTGGGFFVDDIIVGFAGRGEMVTNSSGQGSTFTNLEGNPFAERTKNPDITATPQLLTGLYQLEIRRGQEYGAMPSATKVDVKINTTFNINDRLAEGQTVFLGDNVQSGDLVTIYDGVKTTIFEFRASGAAATGHVAVDISTISNPVTQKGLVAVALANQIMATYGGTPVNARAVGAGANSDRVDIFGAITVTAQSLSATPIAIAMPAQVEDNDTLATATSSGFVLSTHGTYTGSGVIGNGSNGTKDVDFYSFRLNAGQSVTFDVDLAGGGDSYLRIFNFLGTELANNDNSVGPAPEFSSFESFITFVAPTTAIYYLGISDVANTGYLPKVAGSGTAGSTFNYVLNVVTGAAPTFLSSTAYNRLGDENLLRQQGEFIIENNSIISVSGDGIWVDDEDRIGGLPHPGAALNTPVQNTQRLVTGVYIQNNVIARFANNGINISGDGTANASPAVTPFVKVVNNTIYGQDSRASTSATADVIFLMDDSGSMGGPINLLVTRLLQFDAQMQAAGISANYGLVQFPRPSSNAPRQTQDIVDFATFTAPGSPFLNIGITGAIENGSEAILEALNLFDPTTTFSLRPGARTVLVMLSDEDDDSTQAEANQALAALVAANAIFFDICTLPPSSSDNTAARYGVMASTTGGQLLSIQSFVNNPDPFFSAFTFSVVGAIGAVPTANGINVVNNASATIMNNVIVNTLTGINIDSTSTSTEVDANLFQGNLDDGTLGNNAIYGTDTSGVQLFVNPISNNFYPAPGSPLVDSSRNSFNDRASYVAVTGPLGIPQSPILAPNFDRYGQLRVDDSNQAGPPNQPGLGANPFQDRGAIERADFEGGIVIASTPQDNDAPGVDLDPSVSTIWIDAATPAAPFTILTNFTLQLVDAGIGIDDSSVDLDGSDFLLLQNGVPLVEGQDYFFTYNQNTNQAIFTSVSTFPLDSRYQIVINPQGITDYAGNFLQNNQSVPLTPANPLVGTPFDSSLLYFTYIVTDGVNNAPVNTAPATVTMNEDGTFSFTAGNQVSVTDADAFLAADGDPTLGTIAGRIRVTLTVPDNLGTISLGSTANLTSNGGTISGTGSVSDPLIIEGRILDINSALSGLKYKPPADFPAAVPTPVNLTIKTEDLGKFGPPAPGTTVPLTTTNVVVITVNPVNDVPIFVIGPDQTVLEDAAAQSVSNWATSISPGTANEAAQNLTFVVTANSNPSLFSVAPAISATGTLTYTLAPNANGFADISIQLMDDFGTLNGGVDTSAAQTFRINVTPVNDAPSFTKGANQIVLEDSGVTTVAGWATAIAAGPANEAGQVLTFNITGNTNPGLFSVQPAISPAGQLTYTLAPNANTGLSGPATITVTLSDNGGVANSGFDTSGSQSFTITVTPVNDVPSFTKGPDQIVDGVTLVNSVPNWATSILAGPADEVLTQNLTFEITGNTNPGLFAVAPAVSPTGTLTYTLTPTANGETTITIRLKDDGGVANSGVDTSATQTFKIRVTFNDAPTFTKGPDQTVLEDAVAQTIPNWATAISAGPPDEAGQSLTFNVIANSNPSMFLVAPAISPTGTLTYTLAPNANGTAQISITLSDNGGTVNGGQDTSVTQTFNINAIPVNDVPSFTKGSNQLVLEDAAPQSITNWATAILAGPPNESSQILDFIVTANTNPGLFSVAPAIAANGTLTYTLAPNANGSADITIKLHDDAGTANAGVDTSATQTFRITATAVNDSPTFIKGNDQSLLEDAAAQTIPNWATAISAGPSDESGQLVTFNVTGNSNPGLFSVAPAISPTGTLTYTLAPNANGTANITVTLNDNGGTANSGSNTSVAQSFSITVTPVNDIPSFVRGADQSILEDAPAQNIVGWATSISAGPPNESGQALQFNIIANTNPGLFSVAPSISPTGTLSYTLAPNANGMANIRITLSDNGGTLNGGVDTTVSQTFNIIAAAVNDAPSFVKGADQTVLEDALPQVIPGWATSLSTGPANESSQLLSFNITGNSNPGLFSVAPFISPTGTLSYTLAPNANGTSNITVTLSDNGDTSGGGVNTSAPQTFSITATPVNDVPAFTKGADQAVLEDAAPQTIANWATAISAGAANESSQVLTFVVVNNSNPGLFSVAPAIGANGTLTYTLAPNINGTATITVQLKDDAGTLNGGVDTSSTQSFNITAAAVNDVPSFVKGPDQFVLEDAVAQTINGWATAISVGPANESGQQPTFTVVSNSNPSLFSAAPVIDPVTGNLTYKLAANANGVATITVKLSDNGGTLNGGVDTSATQSFNITATAVNDVPSFVYAGDLTVLEDALPQTISGWATQISAGPADESAQVLTFNVTGNSNPSLFSVAPAISATGTLTYTLAPNANGTANISITLSDSGNNLNGGVNTTTPRTFNITATAVNDVPTFTKGSDQTVIEDASPQTIPGWATGISAGAPNESSQQLTFVVTANSNPNLFITAPAIAANGTLTYTLAPNANGFADITVTLTDRAGTTNGGVDTSGPQTFKITATAAPDAPSDISLSGSTVLENQPIGTVIGILTGFDVDLPNDTLSYSLVSGIGGADNGAFQIVGNQLQTSQILNFEAKNSYSIRVRVSDLTVPQSLSFEKQFTISVLNVNEPATSIITLANPISGTPNSIPENQPANSVVGTLFASDPDAGDVSTFALVPGNGATDNAAFKIVNGQLIAIQPFNLEAKGSYAIRVRATDSSGLGFDAAMTIFVTNVNETPTNINLSNSAVLENSAAGTVVGDLTTVDVDAGDTFTYSLVTGNGATDNAKFSISGGQLVVVGPLNYEDPGHAYSIRVQSRDFGGLVTQKVFSITILDVNEAPTALSLSTPNIDENKPVNTVVGTFNTTDQDSPESFTYSLVAGAGSTDNGAFNISGNKLVSAQIFDFEAKSSYSVRVRSTDSANHSIEQAITITINNKNDGPVVTLSSSTGFTTGRKEIAIDGGATVVDFDSPNFNNGKIVLGIQLGEQTGDTLSVLNGSFGGSTIKLTRTTLKLGKTQIATVTGGEKGVPLTIQFIGATSKELFQAVLQLASFKGKPFAAPRVVNVQAFDELGIGGNVATRNITVN